VGVVRRTRDVRNKRQPSRIETIKPLLDVIFRSQNIQRGVVEGVGNPQTVKATEKTQDAEAHSERQHGRRKGKLSRKRSCEERKLTTKLRNKRKKTFVTINIDPIIDFSNIN
jgi:hypothetical protein